MSNKNFQALIFGGDGEIGGALARTLLKTNAGVVTTSRRRKPEIPNSRLLNLEHPERFQLRGAVDVAFFCAGMTSPATCQEQPGLSWTVNVQSQIRLLRELYAQGTFIVYFSSNLVFDGTTSHVKAGDRHQPLCRFAEQKVAIEEHLSKLDNGYSIVRVSKAVGPTTPFLRTWANQLRAGEMIQAVQDMSIAPVDLDELIRCVMQIGTNRKEGIFQFSGDKDVPYDRMAIELAEQLGVSSGLVESIDADSASWPIVARPDHTTLDSSRAKQELEFNAMPWSEVLRNFVESNRLRGEQPYSSIR